jgi:hypothetical protein
MRTIPFAWHEQGSLAENLLQSFDRLAVQLDVIGRPQAIRLTRRQAPATVIWSRAHDVAFRRELGVLEFSTDEGPLENELCVDVPASWGSVVAIEKLIIETNEVRAESGIAFKNAHNEEIVVVSGAQPYGLAIKVPWQSNLPTFAPEYCLNDYRREPMSIVHSHGD